MPGTVGKWHKLNKLAIATNQQMRRNLQTTNLTKVGMGVPVEAVREQLLDFGTAKLAWWQADAVNNEQFRVSSTRSFVLVRACTLPGRLNQPAIGIDVVRSAHGWLPHLPGKTIVMVMGVGCQRPLRNRTEIMSLSRLFVSSELETGQQLQLDKEQAHYVGRVLRLHIGDSMTFFNGEGGEFDATLESIGKNVAVALIGARRDTTAESPLKVHLVQGISRGERMDLVIQKATELGVKRISPILTEYGVIKLDARRAAKRRDHWQGVAQSACEQSGRTRPPLIDELMALNAWFGAHTKEADTDLILRPGAATALTSLSAPTTKVCLLIGPEGGFSDTEYEDAALAGFNEVSLGPRILRTETAAFAALAIVQALWGDLR